jgi:SAM-dependent methyltransferase
VSAEEALYRAYRSMQRRIAPRLRYSQCLYEEALQRHVGRDTKWLDLGCGHQVLPRWRSVEEKRLVETCKKVVGVDFDLPSLKNHRHISLRARVDIARLPLKESAFDLVTANMVVEHLSDPDVQFREVWRVLEPDGLFIFHTPNALGYVAMLARMVPDTIKRKLVRLLDGRPAEDVFPAFYRANTRGRITRLARAVGFEVEDLKMVASDAVFEIIPPLAAIELLWLRILLTKPFRALRPAIIAVMRKTRATPVTALGRHRVVPWSAGGPTG